MPKKFFEKINYSASNEDSDSERKSLKINTSDIVLCICGSGARTLDLLIESPLKIVSIDFNKTQNYLLELKIAAYKHFTYKQFSEFVGLAESNERLNLFKTLSVSLSDESNDFWKNNTKLIESGILYCGSWERFLRNLVKFSFIKRKTIDKLLLMDNIEEQRKVWIKYFDNYVWKFILKIICNRFLWMNIVQEPGAKLIPKKFRIYDYIKSRLDYLGMNFIIKSNHFANLLFQGYYGNECVLPHHLRKVNFDIIKQNIDKVQIVSNSLSDFLEDNTNIFTAFSLSDFSSYSTESEYNSIWAKIINASSSNARFCERQFLVKRSPEVNFDSIIRDTELEQNLFNTDLSAIYTFCAGTISK